MMKPEALNMMKPEALEDTPQTVHPNLTPEEIAQRKEDKETCACCVSCVVLFFFILYFLVSAFSAPTINPIKIISMDFTAEPNNNKSITQNQSHNHLPLVSARWDLMIRLPGELVGNDVCLQGNLQASYLYKNVTLVTSSIHSYDDLELHTPQLLSVSAVATGEDLGGAIGKEIMEAIKERNELQFGSRLSLTDCREETKKGTINYECDEAKLRFELDSDQIKATAFGDHPTCIVKE